MRARLRAELSPRHVPDEILIATAVPRTLTGKKLEIPIKRILQGQPLEQAAAARCDRRAGRAALVRGPAGAGRAAGGCPIALGPGSREQIIRVRSIPLRVVRRGSGRPLLLINGLGATLEMWPRSCPSSAIAR